MSGSSATQRNGGAPIYLVGMMGAGKSTVGPALAERLGRAYVDTDDAVVERAGRSIAEIFDEEGETRFRVLEAEAIEAAGEAGAVVALGGGAMAQPGMPERLAARGIAVWLEVDAETVLARIPDPASRPLLAGLDAAGRLERVESLLAERAECYAKAAIRIDARLEAGRVVESILAALPPGMKNASEADRAPRQGAG